MAWHPSSPVPALVHLCVALGVATVPMYLGWFSSVHADTALDHYAEKPWPVISTLYPSLPMPANMLVNVLYLYAGLSWLRLMLSNTGIRGWRTPDDYYSMYMLCWISILYGPVQFLRLYTMDHRLAVLDQFYTLPGFAWVLVFARHLLDGWSTSRMTMILGGSCLSYCLALVHKFGFDIALGVHIVLVVQSCWQLQARHGTSVSRKSFFKALSYCAGFVVLKLLDNYLPLISSIFNYLSGHFWSKICDAWQVYYVIEFFFILTGRRPKFKSKIR